MSIKKPSYTPGPWNEYTSNSFSRIGTAEGYQELIYGVRMSDGMPTLEFANPADKALVLASPLLAEALAAFTEIPYIEGDDPRLIFLMGSHYKRCIETAKEALQSAGFEL